MGPTDINKQFDNFDKNFDRAWKFGKLAIVASVLGSAVVTGLIGWVIYHFIHKWW
jgi:hypothetical protein